jgi:hypothetical protein
MSNRKYSPISYPKLGYDGTNTIVWFQTGEEIRFYPSEFQSRFHILQNKYDDHQFIYTDGSKEGDSVGSAVVCGRQCMMERVPDVASIFTAELRVIYLVFYHGISSSGDKYIICVDLCPDYRP